MSVTSAKTIERYEPKTLRREWGLEIFIAETDKYLGKVLRMKAGTKGGLQFHVEKDETFHLVSGAAVVRSDDGHGEILVTHMFPGESFHIPPGAPHQVEAVTDCVFFEASTPHYDDRVRVEQDYGLPADGGLPTTRPEAYLCPACDQDNGRPFTTCSSCGYQKL